MTRAVTAGVAARTNRAFINEVFALAFEIYEDGADEADYIRVINDNANITLEGHVFTAFQFAGNLLTDSEEQVTSNLVVQNVDKRIGQAIKNATKIVRCRVLLVDREETSIIYDSDEMVMLTDVEANALFIKGDIGPVISELEPACFLRAIKSVNPGLYL